MGAFNTVTTESSCPFCGQAKAWVVQFKYGNCWQTDYRIGNTLKWGGNDVGENVGGKVRTSGIAEKGCNNCGAEEVWAAVYLENNEIKTVQLLKQELNLGESYFERV